MIKITDHNRWPLIITGAHVGLIGLVIWTIVAVADSHVVLDRADMMNYQKADRDANLIIRDKIAFDKRYNIEYISSHLHPSHAVIVYKIVTKSGKPVDSAKFKIIATRPMTDRDNVTITKPVSIDNGVYTFITKLDGKGRWNIMANVRVHRYERYYNIKTDTMDDNYITRTF